jgi:RNA polymerase sigma-70 factor, ECF subfamily
VSKPQTTAVVRIDPELLARLYRRSKGAQWAVSESAFEEALRLSAVKTLGDGARDAQRVDRHVSSLHVEDLALACACASGNEPAWDHFVLEYRPVLYRAADALAPGGSLREVADSIYAELFGLQEREGERRSLFRYFHGRSSLSTWLRAVLAQRHVDRIRSGRRLSPLEGDESLPRAAAIVSSASPDPDRPRFLALIKLAILRAVASLRDRDRLRLACYYREDLTLAQTGRLLAEHEATVSRQLARTRRAIRDEVERYLRHEHGLGNEELERCLESTIDDAGTLDLGELLNRSGNRKDSEPERSI